MGGPSKIKPKVHRTHGAFEVLRKGLDAVPLALKDREHEVVEHLATREGALAELEHQAAVQVMVTECGFAHLREIMARGENPWTSKGGEPDSILKYLQSWSNGAGRLLIALAEMRGDRDTLDLADMLRKEVREIERGDKPDATE